MIQKQSFESWRTTVVKQRETQLDIESNASCLQMHITYCINAMIDDESRYLNISYSTSSQRVSRL